MRYGNLFQLLAIITLFSLTIFDYRQSKDHVQEVIYRLRVQKSFSNRQSFEYEYGKDYKKVIKEKIEENNKLLLTLWNHMMYKFLVVIILALISIFHFIKYFYVDYDVDHEHLPMNRYDAYTWFLNFLFFAFVSVWYAYFSKGYEGAGIGYVLGILCATKCLWHISKMIQMLKIRKLTGLRLAEIGIATLIYFHLIGFVFLYYVTMFLKLPMILDILKDRT
jgi:hypothetical protein